ncbi:MAG TPA: hypothetical protein VGM90_14595 [Kofleriaceae bacterium]|jgi:hypothetical protein
MATHAQLRKIAMSFPGAIEGGKHGARLAYSVLAKGKDKHGNPKTSGFVWSWMERVHPKKPRVENRDVIAVRVPTVEDKAMIMGAEPDLFIEDPHYNNYPAVIFRLADVTVAQLRQLLTQSYRCFAAAQPTAVVRPPRSPRKPARRAG